MLKRFFLITSISAFILSAGADENEALKLKQKANRNKVEEINSLNEKKFSGQADILVLSGLTADRKEKKVTILAESTTLNPKDIVEFFIIHAGSGHDYESVALSFAAPSDIKKALEFIGMTPGHCVNFRDNRFWPKGERVKIRVATHIKPDALIPIEKFVVDSRTGKTIPEDGFAFTGSIMIRDANDREILAADAQEPKSIASNYNEPQTLLDIPRQGRQDDLYNHQLANPDMMLPPSELLSIVIEPEYKDGTTRIRGLSLTAAPPAEPSDSITNNVFIMTDPSGKPVNEDKSLKSALDVFNSLNSEGRDVYVTVSIADDLTAGDAHLVCQLIQSLEASKSIRIEPPPAGQLYYRAFVPNPAHLNRETRHGHPWELRLKDSDEGITAVLTQSEFDWENSKDGRPGVKSADHEIKSSAALPETIKKINEERKAAAKDPTLPVILVVAPAEMTFRKIMDFIRPSMEIVPIVHIYAGEPVK